MRACPMTSLLQLCKNRLDAFLAQKGVDHPETEANLDIELLIPISQLYGFEYYPSVHRYHEK